MAFVTDPLVFHLNSFGEEVLGFTAPDVFQSVDGAESGFQLFPPAEKSRFFDECLENLDSLSAVLAAQKFHQLTTLTKKAKRMGKCDALIIDYLQLFEHYDDNDSVNSSMEKITKYLKTLSKELDCPIIVLSQFSKDRDSFKNGNPKEWV